MTPFRLRQRAFTLLEMLVTVTVLAILASAVFPLAKNGIRRQKELELRRNLREIRMAIDAYRQDVALQKIKAPAAGNSNCPESLDVLVEGVPLNGKIGSKTRYLRRIPVDPFTGKAEWGLRSINDAPDSTSWGGGNVFDVYSMSQGTGMNEIAYKDW